MKQDRSRGAGSNATQNRLHNYRTAPSLSEGTHMRIVYGVHGYGLAPTTQARHRGRAALKRTSTPDPGWRRRLLRHLARLSGDAHSHPRLFLRTGAASVRISSITSEFTGFSRSHFRRPNFRDDPRHHCRLRSRRGNLRRRSLRQRPGAENLRICGSAWTTSASWPTASRIDFGDWLEAAFDTQVYRTLMGSPERIIVSSFYYAPPARPGVKVVGALVRRSLALWRPSRANICAAYLNQGRWQLNRQIIDTSASVLVRCGCTAPSSAAGMATSVFCR